MALIRDEQGAEYALMECPHCESYEMHAPAEGYADIFQCAQCFAMFRNLD